MDSQKVMCWTTKTWTLIIAWIQTITGGLAFVGYIAALIVFSVAGPNAGKRDDEPDRGELKYLIGFCVLSIIGSLLSTYGGIILLRGAKRDDPSKMKIWLIVKAIGVGFAIVALPVGGIGEGTITIEPVLSILVGVFSWYVVNLHRRILLGQTTVNIN